MINYRARKTEPFKSGKRSPKADHTSTVADEILAALEDFKDALEKGEVKNRLTCHQIKLDLPSQSYTAELVKATRHILNVSQTLFANFLGVSPKTVRAWEQGINSPSTMACRFMDEIRRSPNYWKKTLRQITVRSAG